MSSLLDVVRQSPLAATTILPQPVADLLASVTLPGAVPAGPPPLAGTGTAAGALIPGALDSAINGPVTWTLSEQPGGDGFVLRVTGAVAGAGTPVATVAAATRDDLGTQPARATLTPTGAPVAVAFAGDVVVRGGPAQVATVRPDAAAHAVLSARHLLLPGGFGLSLPTAEIALSADGPQPGAVELIVPGALPIVGGLVLPADLGVMTAGTDVTVPVPRTPADAGGPHVSGTLTFHLPADASLADLVPVALSAVLELPGGGAPFGTTGPHVAETIRVRVSASRPPDDRAAVQVAVTAESDGTDGLVRVTEAADASAVAAGVTTVLGPAMAARAGAAGAATLGVLFAAAQGFQNAFAPTPFKLGGMVLHGVTLQASTTDTTVGVHLDVEGAVQANPLSVEPLLRIQMSRPMRVRWRNVRAVIDVTAASIEDAINVDLQGAHPDVVDPGGWIVEGPGNLFEVIGSRGGSGSTWFEVDLRFTVDLGPVRVSGATIRATFADESLSPDIGLRGLDASVELPGVLRGGGKVTVARELDVELWAQIVPLRVNGFIAVNIDGPRVVLSAGVDLPAPILLGPTGLGLFSLSATIGTNTGMKVVDPADPMKSLRSWRPWPPSNEFESRPGDLTLGAAVVVGTAVDDGFSVNALGVVGVTVPDFALRIGLDAAFFHDRHDGHEVTDRDSIKAHSDNPDAGLTVLGGLSATPSALDVGLEGHLSVPFLFKMDVPVAGHFDASTWWLHIGSDDGVGGVKTGRPPGPMKAVVFPGLGPLQVDAGWAFLMIRGDGIDNLAGTDIDLSGFSVAAGIGFRQVFGLKPVVWAEVSASLIAAIGTRPITIWAQGRLDGRVGLGPFRIGVSAQATILLTDGQVDLHFKVCAVVDLFFTDLKGCIEIGSDTKPLTAAPAPDPWPLPTITLADGIGRLLTDPNDPAAGHLVGEDDDAPAAGWSSTPTVWPDTIPLLTFPIAPVLDPGAGVRNEVHAGLSGSGRFQHEWHLTTVLLEHITAAGATGVPLDTTSAWQVPSDVSTDAPTAITSDQRQLALLTVQQGISLVHQAAPPDGSIPANVAQAADSCHRHPRAGAAWTFGADARRAPEPRSWRVPPRDRLIGFPTSWATFTRGVGFDVISPAGDPIDLLANIAATGLVDDGGVVAFAPALDIDDTSFAGALRLWGRTAAAQEEQPPPARHMIRLHEPMADGYLLVDTGRGDDPSWLTATVDTETGSRQADIEPADGPPGMWRVILARAGDSRATAVELNARGLRPLAILGLSATAAAMGDHATTSASDSAALSGLPPDTLVDGSGRVVLEAAGQYRITVTLAYHDRVDGITAPTATDSRTRHWFFRTAGKDPKAKAAQSGGPAAADATPWGNTVVAPWKRNPEILTTKTVFSRVNRFDPGFMSRYLTGYTPADHEPFHFTGDPVSATFRAPYIAQLAEKMGRGIGLAARRTDQAGPHIFLLGALLPTLLAGGVHGPGLSAADLLGIAAEAAGCPVLPDGAQLSGTLPLQPQTPYELSVGLPLTGQTFKAGDPELEGITFTTSAFHGPVELIEAFNTVPDTVALASAPTAHGDLAIGAGGNGDPVALGGLADGSLTDDAQLEQTLVALGLPPLRPVAQPRSTVLWALTAERWGVAGLLLESSEPLNRQGRMGVHSATFNGAAFGVLRGSRAGTRLLWLRRDPPSLAAAAALVLTADNGGVPFTRQLRVEPQPRFLQGAIKARQS